MPKVALAPLIMIWFGMGMESKVVLSALLSFFPMLVNTVEGLKSVDSKRVALFKVLGASRLQTLWRLKIPNALPFILAGIELGAIYAMLGAIVAEFVGSPFGIGAYLMSMTYQMDAAGSFAILLVLALYGMTVQFMLRAARRKFLFWSRIPGNSDGGV
jgi:NitT/TauT family transport system permease protein